MSVAPYIRKHKTESGPIASTTELTSLLTSQNYNQLRTCAPCSLILKYLFLMTCDPVSYTHLDVYKRQVWLMHRRDVPQWNPSSELPHGPAQVGRLALTLAVCVSL